MADYLELLDDRERALVIWSAVVTCALLIWSSTREVLLTQAPKILKALFLSRLILIPLGGLAFMAPILVLADIAGVWNRYASKEAVIWGLGAVALLFSALTASRDEEFFARTVRQLAGLTVVMVVVMNAYTYGLIIELILLPILAVLAMTRVVAATYVRYESVLAVNNFLLTGAGLLLLIPAVWGIATSPASLLDSDRIAEFLVPPVLTILILPYAYLVALLGVYESLFVTLKHLLRDRPSVIKGLRFRVMRACHLSVVRVNLAHRRLPSLILRNPTDTDLTMAIDEALANISSQP